MSDLVAGIIYASGGVAALGFGAGLIIYGVGLAIGAIG